MNPLRLLATLLGLSTPEAPTVPVYDLWPRFVVASEFGKSEDDPSNPHDDLPCLGRRLRDDDMVIAASWLPCRLTVMIVSQSERAPQKPVYAVVADRMGHGLNRGGIDLAPAVAKALHHRGVETVVLIPLPAGTPFATMSREAVTPGPTGSTEGRN